MTCSRCGADCPAGMKFCGQCGAPLGSTCPSCGAANPPGQKFCGQCGASLDPPGLQDSAAPEPYVPKPPAPGRPHSSRRNETSYRPVLRHRQLDPADRAARAPRRCATSSALSRGEPGGGASLWRHGAAIHRRRVHGPVRGAAHSRRPCTARSIGGPCHTTGAPRRRRGSRPRAVRADGSNWHSHGPGRLRPGRR